MMSPKFSLLGVLVSLSLISCQEKCHVCVYGGSSAGVTAAYSAARQGCSVTLICPDVTLGGMTTGGLGQTDIGNKQAVIGLARQFYRKLGTHYGKLEQWIFEPHVAEEILMTYLDDPKINVMTGCRLDSVRKEGARIASIFCHRVDGSCVSVDADQFIDCTYEGDLMAQAGVRYQVGREANTVYGETWNGSQLLDQHQFPDGVDPFIVPGHPESGLLWGIGPQTCKPDGTGQTSGEWVKLGTYSIRKGKSGSVRFTSPGGDIHADGLLLVKKEGGTE